MFPTKFRFIWLSSFGEEDFQKSTNQKQALPMAAMFVYGSKRNEDLPQMLPIKFRFNWQSGFRGEDFFQVDQSETRIAYGSHVC